MATTKFGPVWRVLTLLLRADMIAVIAITIGLFAFLALH
ncbi:MAG: hypothetical protein QOJ96_2580 [Alphaproteobacteria bacterium]|jgi:hypothetical protein|nr:hypothetical protein [Alphaproteobacteria bacterium]